MVFSQRISKPCDVIFHYNEKHFLVKTFGFVGVAKIATYKPRYLRQYITCATPVIEQLTNVSELNLFVVLIQFKMEKKL